jgi:RND family efflux transporter MFP subunit
MKTFKPKQLNQLSIVTIAFSLVLVFSLTACGRKGPGGGRPQKDTAQSVMVEELSLQPLDEFINVSGKLEGITDVTMSSETAGRIVQLNKRLGDYVKQGDRIGMVENEVMKIRLDQAEAAYASAEAGLQNAQKNLNYAEASRAKNLISDAEYNTSLSAFKGAKAGFDGAKAGLESARLAYANSYLVAPASGKISNLMVTRGQLINPGQAVASITDASTLIIKSGVGETQIAKLRNGQAVTITTLNSDRKYSGRVRGFGIRPAPGTSTYPLEIEVVQPGDLMPGMVVKASINVARYNNLLYTPITNIVKEYGKNYLYIVSEGKAVKREITLGRTIGANVELLSGVNPGDLIITTGVENLGDGSPVTIRQ